jgi:hypothetical protein
MSDRDSLIWFCIRGPVLLVLFIASMLLVAFGCTSNHCRADQRIPEGKTFDDLERMTREECK